MFSPDGEVSAARLDAFVDDLDGFISPASKTLRFGLVLMLSVIRWSPLLFFRFTPFDEMSVEDRVKHLERLEHSKVKQLPLLVVAYKTIMTMIFYEDEEEQRHIGYPGARKRKRWLTVTKHASAHAHAKTHAAASCSWPRASGAVFGGCRRRRRRLRRGRLGRRARARERRPERARPRRRRSLHAGGIRRAHAFEFLSAAVARSRNVGRLGIGRYAAD